MNITDRYELKLNESLKWTLSSSDKAAWWLERLACIMGLGVPSGNGTERLIICLQEETESLMEDINSDDSWRLINDLKYMKFYENNLGVSICSLCSLMDKESVYMCMWSLMPYFFEKTFMVGGIPQHCTLIEYNGKGLIIAATGGTGKSTCARRLPESWDALCDDEALILKEGGIWYARPFPTWSDYLWDRDEKKAYDTHYKIPLAAIYFLEQSENDSVSQIGSGETATTLYRFSTHVCNRYYSHLKKKLLLDYQSRLFENACSLSKEIPSFVLRASINGRFWEKIESTWNQTTNI